MLLNILQKITTFLSRLRSGNSTVLERSADQQLQRELAEAARSPSLGSLNMVSTRSQDQDRASSTTRSKSPLETGLLLRLSGNKKRSQESRTATPTASTKRRKLDDVPSGMETHGAQTVAAVVIPRLAPEETTTFTESKDIGAPTDPSSINGGMDGPAEEEQAPTFSRGESTLDDSRPVFEKQAQSMSNERPTASSRRKAKKPRRRDSKRDLSSLINFQSHTPTLEPEAKPPKLEPTSKHRRFDNESEIDTVDLQPSLPSPPENHESSGVLAVPQLPEGNDIESSEDEAPEEVTKSKGLKTARAAAAEATKAVEAQQAVEKQRRRDRDRLLKSQSQLSKKQPQVTDADDTKSEISSDDDMPDQVAPPPLDDKDQMDWSKQLPLPELLPEEVLAAEPAVRPPTPPPQNGLVKAATNKKRRFLEKKEKPIKDLKRGNVRIRVLDDRRSVLPPKVSKSSRMIRETWLNGRPGATGKPMFERRKVGGGFVRR